MLATAFVTRHHEAVGRDLRDMGRVLLNTPARKSKREVGRRREEPIAQTLAEFQNFPINNRSANVLENPVFLSNQSTHTHNGNSSVTRICTRMLQNIGNSSILSNRNTKMLKIRVPQYKNVRSSSISQSKQPKYKNIVNSGIYKQYEHQMLEIPVFLMRTPKCWIFQQFTQQQYRETITVNQC